MTATMYCPTEAWLRTHFPLGPYKVTPERQKILDGTAAMIKHIRKLRDNAKGEIGPEFARDMDTQCAQEVEKTYPALVEALRKEEGEGCASRACESLCQDLHDTAHAKMSDEESRQLCMAEDAATLAKYIMPPMLQGMVPAGAALAMVAEGLAVMMGSIVNTDIQERHPYIRFTIPYRLRIKVNTATAEVSIEGYRPAGCDMPSDAASEIALFGDVTKS